MFTLSNWSRQSSSLNTGETPVDGVPVGGPAFFTYRSVTDNAATIAGSGYFSNVVYDLSVDDLIYCQASDVIQWLVVATVNRSTGAITTETAGFSGPVGTANIEDGAVTTAKIAANAVTGAKIAQNAVGSFQLAADILQYGEFDITATQFKAAYATPILLLPAVTNTLYLVAEANIEIQYGTAAYAAGGNVALQYDATAHGGGVPASSSNASSAFQVTADTLLCLEGITTSLPAATTVGKSLCLSNITAAFTTGDSDMTIRVWFRQITPTA